MDISIGVEGGGGGSSGMIKQMIPSKSVRNLEFFKNENNKKVIC